MNSKERKRRSGPKDAVCGWASFNSGIGPSRNAIGCVAGIVHEFALLLAGGARFGRNVFLKGITAFLAFPVAHDFLLLLRSCIGAVQGHCFRFEAVAPLQ